MPLPPDDKKQVAERLMRGEDVVLTAHADEELKSSPPDDDITSLSAGTTSSESPSTNGHTTHHGHDHTPEPDDNVPADLVIQILGQRASARETDLAIREARILVLEARVRELQSIIEHISQGA